MKVDLSWAGDASDNRFRLDGNALAESLGVKILPHHLQKHFNLTEKEAEIAVRLIANERQSEIVATLNISPNTFKTHRKRIYEKMSVARQIDLVALGEALRELARRDSWDGA